MKISFHLENCYGIGNMNHNFDFKNNKAIIIHSSNGTMKTSLCKTISDVQTSNTTKDQVDSRKITKRDIKINNTTATADDFLVFKSYENSSVKDSLSKIILNSTLKNIYDATVQDQISYEDDLLLKLSKNIGQKPEKTRNILLSAFNASTLNEAIIRSSNIRVSSLKIKSFANYNYKDLFDTPVKKALQDKTVSEGIRKYNQQYNKIIKKSSIFTFGIFDIANLRNISTVLKGENYFKGGHKLLIKSVQPPIENEEQLEKLIRDEINSISKNIKIQESFSSITDKAGNQKNLSTFYEVIKEDNNLSKQYTNIEKMEKMYLSYHLSQYPNDVQTLKIKTKNNKSTIRSLIRKANQDIPEWLDIISLFKTRFNVPYDISIENKGNAILGLQEPNIKFSFGSQPIDEEPMVANVLSSSEKRAYYFLQVLFEIENEKKSNKNKIIVFDDIADSFDYTNKYAIIEYLNEISSYSKFHLLVLTHNFDFYRSFGLKVATRNNCYFGLKDNNNIEIKQGEYLKNLFQIYKQNIGKDILIDLSVIGFARNLIEYYVDDYKNDDMYLFYTKLLHYRPHARRTKINTLYNIYKKQFGLQITKSSSNSSIYSLIITNCDQISNFFTINQKIEEKIVLSLGLRLRCEKYMYNKLKKVDPSIKNNIMTMSFGKLYEEFLINYPTMTNELVLLKRVMILTPYHVHINSFMFEPMIDVSIQTLRNLYIEVKNEFGNF